VGALVLLAMAVLVGLIIAMSGATGGLFARKLTFRSYFENAAGVKDGAPVTLEGVTIGNVTHIRVVPARNPFPVEVTLQVGEEFLHDLHTDSTASIAQAGVLGDSYVDISSAHASGPEPQNNAELKAAGSPSIQDVIRTSEDSITEIQTLVKKFDILLDSVNAGKGTLGRFVNDPQMAKNVQTIVANLQTITATIANGNGSIGKLIKDDTLYNHANSVVDKLDKIAADLNDGKGSAGKFLKDEALYKNLNETVANTNELVAEINQGKGSIGMLAKDKEFARKLNDTVAKLDAILSDVNEGKGTVGQLFTNRSLYDHADATMDEAQKLVKSMRENPKKYLVIQLKLF
jgi:phospholipid/cholesterol/gamma-HCH transport system substrate-binding protein